MAHRRHDCDDDDERCCTQVEGCKGGRPVHVKIDDDDCVMIQGCEDEDATPVKVTVDPKSPPFNVNERQYVFNGDPTTPNQGWEPQRTPSVFTVATNLQETIPAAIWTPATGKKFRLMGFSLTSSLAGQFNLRDGFGGPILVSLILQAGVPYPTIDLGNGILSATASNPLVLEGPGPIAAISGLLWGQEN